MAEMRRTTVRMPDHFYALVEHEAEESGLSVAGLVREAVLARVIWGRAMRGESVYAVAAQAAVAARGGEAPDPGEVSRAVHAILEHAPGALDDALRALDANAPEQARYVRELYGVPPGEYAIPRDAVRIWPRTTKSPPAE